MDTTTRMARCPGSASSSSSPQTGHILVTCRLAHTTFGFSASPRIDWPEIIAESRADDQPVDRTNKLPSPFARHRVAHRKT